MAGTTATGKRLIRSKSGLRIVPLNDSDRSPFELREPEWIPDKLSPTCMDCKEKFDFLKRRHHCRRCGRVCCSSCCENRVALPRMCFLDPVRVCTPCAEATSRENIFYNKDLKALVTGAILCLGNDASLDLVQCRLSSDHRFFIVSGPYNDSAPPLSIPMHRIMGLQVGSRNQNPSGNCTVSSLVVQYCLAGEEEKEISLAAPPDASASAFAFLTALEKAMFMMQESRAVIGTGE
ncbi:zinc finger FYVE domain-containing protein 21 [Procambarus clarkii]|uniref:zinc finger FYVE domain-containing protein 21 n=1 Tax=Procambarus clarkii TaxID=6728 RepID=UPI001E672F0A|nr:zinc finger FYVE domain-containing protein 21-like [Procambarus clarkii]